MRFEGVASPKKLHLNGKQTDYDPSNNVSRNTHVLPDWSPHMRKRQTINPFGNFGQRKTCRRREFRLSRIAFQVINGESPGQENGCKAYREKQVKHLLFQQSVHQSPCERRFSNIFDASDQKYEVFLQFFDLLVGVDHDFMQTHVVLFRR